MMIEIKSRIGSLGTYIELWNKLNFYLLLLIENQIKQWILRTVTPLAATFTLNKLIFATLVGASTRNKTQQMEKLLF